MATPIDYRFLDTSFLCDIPLETRREFQLSSPEPWETFIDFDGIQAHPPDGQSLFPGSKTINELPSSNESNIAPTTSAYEHVYPSQVHVNDLPWVRLQSILSLTISLKSHRAEIRTSIRPKENIHHSKLT